MPEVLSAARSAVSKAATLAALIAAICKELKAAACAVDSAVICVVAAKPALIDAVVSAPIWAVVKPGILSLVNADTCAVDRFAITLVFKALMAEVVSNATLADVKKPICTVVKAAVCVEVSDGT